ncbi:LysM peptidoglycan-binding domain-containing protein, partial [Anaerolineales bacterium HSG24]|nr:LysM peptidoglycan-binding domain-containing protein [Anaerolineales bacterium HSG24]
MKQIMILIGSIILVILVLPSQLVAQEPTCQLDYTVQSGDWLSRVSEKYLGDPLEYNQLVRTANSNANDRYTNIDNPNVIEPGWILCIPAEGSGSGDIRVVYPTVAPPVTPTPRISSKQLVLNEKRLENLTYNLSWAREGEAVLVDGLYREAGAPGAADRLLIKATDHIAYGIIDGQSVAVVVLMINVEERGTFYELALVVTQDGQVVNVGTTLLGERIELNQVAIKSEEIVVDMVQIGPDDMLCCPTEPVIKRFDVDVGERALVETASERPISTPENDSESDTNSDNSTTSASSTVPDTPIPTEIPTETPTVSPTTPPTEQPTVEPTPSSTPNATPTPPPTSTPAGERFRGSLVWMINTVTVELRPEGYYIIVTGKLPDSCTTLGRATQRLVDRTITINLPAILSNKPCTTTLNPFTHEIRLNVTGLTIGEY